MREIQFEGLADAAGIGLTEEAREAVAEHFSEFGELGLAAGKAAAKSLDLSIERIKQAAQKEAGK